MRISSKNSTWLRSLPIFSYIPFPEEDVYFRYASHHPPGRGEKRIYP